MDQELFIKHIKFVTLEHFLVSFQSHYYFDKVYYIDFKGPGSIYIIYICKERKVGIKI